ncbi:unnamed protein product [Ilex paraguariensis]|uniref:Uncharacterized protein n=1 Tax=Ilex paraguariensis TaxID=185542 RepID=A0ABC8RX13_9AQUA
MMKSSKKLFLVALVVTVLILGLTASKADARRIAKNGEVRSIMLNFDKVPYDSNRVNLEMVPRDIFVPPPTFLHSKSIYQMLPKVTTRRQSGLSSSTSDAPSSPPRLSDSSGIYQMLPKGIHVPPSGPSTKTSDPPPPPPKHIHRNFGGPLTSFGPPTR